MDTLVVLFTKSPYLLIWAGALFLGLGYKIDLRKDADEFDIAHEAITAVLQMLAMMTLYIVAVLAGSNFLNRLVLEIISALVIGNTLALIMPLHYYYYLRAEQTRGASHPLSFVPVTNPREHYTQRNGARWYQNPIAADKVSIGHPPKDSPWYNSIKKFVGKA